MFHSVQTIAVTGGKGGVGKTNVAVNLSIELSRAGKRVVLLDADLGLANVDILLGVRPEYTIEDLLAGECTINDLLLDGPMGLKIVPAASGTQELVNLSPLEHSGLIHAFSELEQDIDILIIDTAAGISQSVMNFVRASNEVMLVVTNEPTSITDAYATLKLLNSRYKIDKFHLVANMVKNLQEANEVYQKILHVTDRFLDVAIELTGAIPYDMNLKKAVRKQKAICESYPDSASAIAFRHLAQKVERWPLPAVPRGYTEFFVDRLVKMAANG